MESSGYFASGFRVEKQNIAWGDQAGTHSEEFAVAEVFSNPSQPRS